MDDVRAAAVAKVTLSDDRACRSAKVMPKPGWVGVGVLRSCGGGGRAGVLRVTSGLNWLRVLVVLSPSGVGG